MTMSKLIEKNRISAYRYAVAGYSSPVAQILGSEEYQVTQKVLWGEYCKYLPYLKDYDIFIAEEESI